ncbi:uncharacterized protein [Labrus bergylta]|uniref:uncharacterized protein n=1 Tax=Labrus bergylta TaxID=56723 RepID=UPI0033134BCA
MRKGLVWSPEGAKVTRGYRFIFICSINSSYSESQFFLISSDSTIVATKPAINHSASFDFPVAEYKHQGNYSLTAGILLLLLVVLLVICLLCKRGRKAKQPGTLVQTQLAARVGSCYEDDREDYVNVCSVDTEKNLGRGNGVQIRLAGSTHCSGRVELFYGSTWGTVCDDDWDLRDAEVVCRQLSCGKALSAPGSASFGEGADPILLDNVACSGSERSLTACQFSEMGKHNCKHSEDAGVVCSVRLQQPSISLTSPNRGLVWRPEGAEVTRGYRFVFICSINCSYPEGQFFLISSDSTIVAAKRTVNHSASFDFPVAEYKHQGNYSCVYEVELSTRRFNSTETGPISVIIKCK